MTREGNFAMRFAVYGLALLILIAPAAASVRACAQENPDSVPLAPSADAVTETYRLRVENTQYGRVEISVDGGVRYLLIGRVLHPATTFVADKTALAPGIVVRSTGVGLAFSVARDRVVKLRPYQPMIFLKQGRKTQIPTVKFSTPEPSAIVTNIEPEDGIFADLLPPERTPVTLRMGSRALSSFPEEYSPTPDDVYTFSVLLRPPPPARGALPVSDAQRAADWQTVVRTRAGELAKAYEADAVTRAHTDRRAVVSGSLVLRAALPDGEPDPIMAVSYAVDGEIIAVQNVGPYTYAWDTRQVPDGEHVVEIRALNRNANPITSARTLVVVANASPGKKEP